MDLKPYIAPLLKWWWLVLIAAVLAAGSSYLAVREEPIRYQTKATLMIGRPFNDLNPDGGEIWLAQQLAQTYAVFAQREPVQNATMETLGLTWLPEYYVLVPPQTQFIEVSVIDTDPLRAQLVANELAQQIILLSPGGEDLEGQNRQKFISQQLDDLQIQIEETDTEIKNLQAELGELFSAREIADAQEQINALQSKLNSLQQNYATLLSNSEQQATNALTIIEPAVMPNSPIGPNKYYTIALSTFFGALLAIGTAYLLEFLDDRVAAVEDLTQLTGLPVITGVPLTKLKLDGDKPQNLITLDFPRAPFSEAMRSLRTGIQFSNPDTPCKLIMVTSPNPSEGKSMITANLGVVMAQAGYKTLIIDGDMRRPKQHKLFHLENNGGLSNLLLDLQKVTPSTELPSYKIDDFTHQIRDLDLFVLTCGSIPINPSELLGSTKMKQLLEHLPKMFDYILIDSPPILAVTDTVVLAAQVEGVVLVSNARKTKKLQLKRAINRIKEVNNNLIGLVINQITEASSQYYYNYSYAEMDEHDDKARGLKRISGFFMRSQIEKEKDES